MHPGLNIGDAILAAGELPAWLDSTLSVVKVIIGFSLIIVVHELGHFLAAKWVGIRVDRFAIGFGYRLFGWRRGEGLTFGKRPDYTAEELRAKGYGETDYCFKLLPVGGYVKMLGQDDIQVNDDTGEITLSDDPRSFTNKPVGRRMLVISAGVIFNLLFAVLGFMCVFMMGRPVLAPRIGMVTPDSPAARAGLRPGDIVRAANGQKVESFRDIIVAQILADDGIVRLQVERDGELLPDELVMQVEESNALPQLAAGIAPYSTNELSDDPESLQNAPGLQAGDRITRVGERNVRSAADVIFALTRYAARTGQPLVPVVAERPDPEDPTRVTEVATQVRVSLEVGPAVTTGGRETIADSKHILGFRRRLKVEAVAAGKPADRAGFQPGDVIAQWETVFNPLYAEVVDSINANPNRPIPVTVQRADEQVTLMVTPRRPFRILGQEPPRVGLAFGYEDEAPIVADVAPDTPAAALRLPRGARLTAIDGHPVENWFDVVHRLAAAAGRTVSVRYRSGDVEATGEMVVPSSIVNELDLPPLARILEVAGESSVTVGEQVATLPSVAALRALLLAHAGETVVVRYQPDPDDATVREAEFTVAADGSNADPWQMRITYMTPALPFKPLQHVIQTNNPVTAIGLGIRQTGDVLREVYRIVKSIAKGIFTQRTSTVQQVSGPVGIIRHALDRAEQGFPALLFFLAFLSVNLAVINFLPFPVVDGGLMVFLIIEKIKGRPLSIKTQMVATLVGLATIVLVFLLVTFNDISRWIG